MTVACYKMLRDVHLPSACGVTCICVRHMHSAKSCVCIKATSKREGMSRICSNVYQPGCFIRSMLSPLPSSQAADEAKWSSSGSTTLKDRGNLSADELAFKSVQRTKPLLVTISPLASRFCKACTARVVSWVCVKVPNQVWLRLTPRNSLVAGRHGNLRGRRKAFFVT
jgi:hypothetical protein